MPDKKEILAAAGGYLKQHPDEIVRALRNAAGLRVGLPLEALRWLAGQAKGKRAPKDVQIEAVPPGIRISATVNAMGTPVRAGAAIFVEAVRINAEELRFEIRVRDVSLKVLDESSESPLAGLLKSGALDLSKPGDLVGFMPKRPAILIEAKGDRLVLDLKKLPKLQNGKADRLLRLITPLVTVLDITTDPGHVDFALAAFPDGLSQAVAAVRRAL
ncbi:MAG TPA: hypothetical protein VK524_14310 [Polyangiaceae bacterium]|nr:hypothetical protein [Polyangiaceae bacterium]